MLSGLDEHNNTYSVMVVKGKNIVYMGYSVPLAYDDAKIVDLGGRAVLPLVNDKMCLTYSVPSCSISTS